MRNLNYIFTSETKALADERALIVRITNATKDRAGDIVEPTGVQLDNYRKNPVVLFAHNYDELPIARAEELSVTEDGITAKVVFPTEGTYEKADIVYALAKQGIGNAWSIGFIPDMKSADRLDDGGYRIKSWEMLEFSAVPVPANPDAVTLMRSKGFTDEQINEVVEEKEIEVETIEKDVEETVALADVIGYLDFLIWMFGQNGVNDDSRNKMKAALAILMDVLKDQAEVGKKAFTFDPNFTQTDLSDTPPQSDMLKALTALRDDLRLSDKTLGLALRTLKQLLEESTTEGGEH